MAGGVTDPEPKTSGTAEIRKSGKLHPNFWKFFPEKRF
jgi:hypothetical protein